MQDWQRQYIEQATDVELDATPYFKSLVSVDLESQTLRAAQDENEAGWRMRMFLIEVHTSNPGRPIFKKVERSLILTFKMIIPFCGKYVNYFL